MKKSIILGLFVVLLVVSGLYAGEKKESGTYNDIYVLYKAGKYQEALEQVEKKMKTGDTAIRLVQLKYNLLTQLKKFREALILVEKEIKKRGETDALMQAKSNALMRLGKTSEAIRVAVAKYKRSKEQSPWDCMNIMHLYLQVNDVNESLNWLQEAVRQGFINFRLLSSPRYKLLEKHKRFYQIIDTIKFSVGLGEKAKEFKTPLLSCGHFSLSENKGKVILVQFWATWCGPCVAETRYLKILHDKYKNEGFEIVGISLDSDVNRAKAFIADKKLEWTLACTGNVWNDETVKTYGVNNLPTYFLIDRNGFLRAMDLKGEDLENAIKDLLKGK